MVEEGQRDPEFETILDMVDPNRSVVWLSILGHFVSRLDLLLYSLSKLPLIISEFCLGKYGICLLHVLCDK